MKLFLFSLPLMFFLWGCDLPGNKTYEDKQLGWKMPIPDNINLLSKATMNDYNAYQSQESIYRFGKWLLSFELKDNIESTFKSTLIWSGKSSGDWEKSEHEYDLQSYISISPYAESGKCDSATYYVEIGNIVFRAFDMTFYFRHNPAYSTRFSRLINNLTFSVDIQAINEKDRNTLLSAWKQSVFSR